MNWLLDDVGLDVETRSHGVMIHHESGAHLYVPDELVDRLQRMCRGAATMYDQLADEVESETGGDSE